jgi:DNA-binding NtrC family response regulator
MASASNGTKAIRHQDPDSTSTATLSALLVHDCEERFLILNSVMEGLSLQVHRARRCREAGRELAEVPPPHLVLTDTVLPDGNWMDVLDLAAKAHETVSVIVVSPVADVGLYLDVMEQGAFDFITDSVSVLEAVHVIRCAAEHALEFRQQAARLSAPYVLTPNHPQANPPRNLSRLVPR